MSRSALAIALLWVGCSGGARETGTDPAAGAEVAEPATVEPATAEPATAEPAVAEPEAAESAVAEPEVEAAEPAAVEADSTPTAETAEEGGAEPAGPEALVCSRFSFDLRSMPHTGPYQVNEGQVQLRVRGLIDDVRVAAGEPIQAFTSGGSSFSAVFSGASANAVCERARATVAPPPPAGATGRRRLGYTRATPCGPCSQLVIDAVRSDG